MSKREERQQKQSRESEQKSQIVEWVEKLSKHFNVELDEDQVEIFLHALRNCTSYQVDIAFERCLNECQFMPKLADVHIRMPEQKYKPENVAAFTLYAPPMVDVIRPFAREICKEKYGRDYDSLDASIPEENKIIFDSCYLANRERYRRMGIDMSRWDKAKLEEVPTTGSAIRWPHLLGKGLQYEK